MTDAQFLAQAVALATDNVAAGGGPFGALVTRDNDPTAHAEVTAIRTACAALDTFSLEGCVLYASCEPCPLCVSASLWARCDRVVFGADRHDAARGGFDDLAFYDLFAQERSTWPMPVSSLSVPDAVAPFDAWLANTERTAY